MADAALLLTWLAFTYSVWYSFAHPFGRQFDREDQAFRARWQAETKRLKRVPQED